MKFDVFTMVRLGWLDGLYYKFRALMTSKKYEKSEGSIEQIKEIEMRNAEYWNEIAIILLNSERVEKDYIKAIEECYEVIERKPKSAIMYYEELKQSYEVFKAQNDAYEGFDKKVEDAYIGEKRQIVDFENHIVWSTVDFSKDGNLIPGYSIDVSLTVYYLEKLYSYLNENEKEYVDRALKIEMFERLKILKSQCMTIEWHKGIYSKRDEMYSLSRDKQMKFEIFTMFRNEWLDALYIEFHARMYIFNNLKCVLTSEQIKKIEMRNAGYWNEVAKILLDFERVERDESCVKRACFEVFKDEDKSLDLAKNKLKKKEPDIVCFLDNIVGSHWISADVRFVVYYLKAMYDCLTKVELPYVDDNLKNEMFEQIKVIESI